MGGVAQAIGDAFSGAAEAVSDVVESVGDLAEDVGQAAVDVVDDVGTWLDKSVIQPIKDDPVNSAIMIAAVTFGGPAAAGYLGTSLAVGTAVAAGTAAAGITAAKGGDVDDIIKAGAVGAGSGAVAAGVSGAVGPTIGTTAGRVVGASVGGATGALAMGRDPLQGALVGGVTSGIAEGVNLGVNELVSQFNTMDFSTTQAPSYEFGMKATMPGGAGSLDGQYGLKPTMPTGSTDYGFGVQAPTSAAITPLYGDYGNIKTEIGTKGISKEFGIDPTKEGGVGIKYDPESASRFGQLNPELPAGGLPSTYVGGSETSRVKEEVKRLASKAIRDSVMDDILGTTNQAAGVRYRTVSRRGVGGTGEEVGAIYGADADVNLNPAATGLDKFELRKFANDAGRSTLISFKGNEPQQPIPEGFKEVERIGAAEGGLIDTTMVKYSKKALMGPRKTVKKPKEQATTRKGLAVKKK